MRLKRRDTIYKQLVLAPNPTLKIVVNHVFVRNQLDVGTNLDTEELRLELMFRLLHLASFSSRPNIFCLKLNRELGTLFRHLSMKAAEGAAAAAPL